LRGRDHGPFDPATDARVIAALDQLLASLSEIPPGGGRFTTPLIVLARVEPGDALAVLHAGIEYDLVPGVLREAADTVETKPPDVTRERRPR
jgi:hypothetical protein